MFYWLREAMSDLQLTQKLVDERRIELLTMQYSKNVTGFLHQMLPVYDNDESIMN